MDIVVVSGSKFSPPSSLVDSLSDLEPGIHEIDDGQAIAVVGGDLTVIIDSDSTGLSLLKGIGNEIKAIEAQMRDSARGDKPFVETAIAPQSMISQFVRYSWGNNDVVGMSSPEIDLELKFLLQNPNEDKMTLASPFRRPSPSTQIERIPELPAGSPKVNNMTLAPVGLTTQILNPVKSTSEIHARMDFGLKTFWSLYDSYRNDYNTIMSDFLRALSDSMYPDAPLHKIREGVDLIALSKSDPSVDLSRFNLLKSDPDADTGNLIVQKIIRKVILTTTLEFRNGKKQLTQLELPTRIP